MPSHSGRIDNVRPLYFNGTTLYCARYNQIVATDDLGQTFRFLGKFEVSSRFRILLDSSALARRVMRMTIYRLRVADNGNIVFIFRGGIYLLRKGETEARCVRRILKGSRPVSLASRPGGLIVWGEYHDNPERGEMCIYGSRDHGESWQAVYTFPAHSIRHIHGITYDEYDDCFWICTGDHDGENQLLKADATFQHAETILQSGQENRFYSTVVTPDYVLAANDSPNADNFVRRFQKKTGVVTNLARIDNSSFYSCLLNGWYFCSTNAERPESQFPKTFQTPNDFSGTHVWMVNIASGRAAKVLSFPIDLWYRMSGLPKVPPGLFQYSRVFFPEGKNPTGELVCYALGTRGTDDCMLTYHLEDLENVW